MVAERESPRRQFVDTNVLVYAHDRSAGRKREAASDLLERLWDNRLGCVSLQVLQEFYVTVTGRTRRLVSPVEAARRIGWYAEWTLHEPGRQDLISAIALHVSLAISFWDAMILQSARRLGCGILWTEDLTHEQNYAGVTVRDPFR
ncbi:MAG TPA: PIN domain-containing protein [Thermoanaerobaculia bacterium]